MALIVQKFGGSSIADKNGMMRVARTIIDVYNAGNQVIVVVSAQGDHTDELLCKCTEITNKPNPREMDVLLSTGEMISMSLLAMLLQELGYKSISLTGIQAGIKTDDTHEDASISYIDIKRMKNEIDNGKIIIVAGFQGVNDIGDITTLGRGGSDTSAVNIAAALRADKCQIYTDVDGIYTADPRIVKSAKKLDSISYDMMLELSSLGAEVLHNKCVLAAKENNVNIEVLSSFSQKNGSLVEKNYNNEHKIAGITKKDMENFSRISVVGNLDDDDIYKIREKLLSNNINIYKLEKNDKNSNFYVDKDKIVVALNMVHNIFF